MGLRFLALSALAGLTAACAGSAQAAPGEWRLDPRRCPDLVEDRVDRRVTRGRADLREDRRDARVINCPARAWVWTGSRRGVRTDPARPAVTAITVRPGGYYYRPRRGADFVAVRLVVR